MHLLQLLFCSNQQTYIYIVWSTKTLVKAIVYPVPYEKKKQRNVIYWEVHY